MVSLRKLFFIDSYNSLEKQYNNHVPTLFYTAFTQRMIANKLIKLNIISFNKNTGEQTRPSRRRIIAEVIFFAIHVWRKHQKLYESQVAFDHYAYR